MRYSFPAFCLGAALVLLGGCSPSSSEQQPAANEEAPTADTAAAPMDRGVQSAPAVGGSRAAPSAASTAPAPKRYACTGSKNTLSVTHAANGATARISFAGQTVAANRSGSVGGHYTASKVDLVEKANAATLTWKGKKYNCKPK